MQRNSPSHHLATTVIAWWTAFLATLALIAGLGLVRSAQASTATATAPSPGPITLAPVAAEDEGEEEEAEAEASEDGEAEDCEVEAAEAGECEEGEAAPAECELSSAEATVTAAPSHNRLRLQLRYATTEPTTVSLDYGLHGSRGALYLGAARKHLGRSGVLHLTRTLTEAQMDKVMAARGFTVRLRVPGVPRYCQSFFDHQLDVRRATPSGLAWVQAE